MSERSTKQSGTRRRRIKPANQPFVAHQSGKVIARASTLAELMANKKVSKHLARRTVTIAHEAPEGMTVAYRGSLPL